MSSHVNGASKNNPRLQMQDAEVRDGSMEHLHKKRSQMMLKQGTGERKVPRRSKEQRVGLFYLSLFYLHSYALIHFLNGSTDLLCRSSIMRER